MKKQSGSAHVIIITVLVLALVGALGYIFWQNMNKKVDTVSTQTTAEQKEPNEETASELTQLPEGYLGYADEELGVEFAYPEEWGELRPTDVLPNSIRLGANGENTTALADTNNGTRVAVFTKDSFVARMASGYTVKYVGDDVMGMEAGSTSGETRTPLAGTEAYAFNYGDADFAAYDLFFAAGDSVFYIMVGNDESTQAEIAKSVNVK